MDSVWRKCGCTDSDVVCVVVWRAIANPLTGGRDDGLTGLYVDCTSLGFHVQTAFEDKSVLGEFRSLSRLHPSCRRLHVSDADVAVLAIRNKWYSNSCRIIASPPVPLAASSTPSTVVFEIVRRVNKRHGHQVDPIQHEL